MVSLTRFKSYVVSRDKHLTLRNIKHLIKDLTFTNVETQIE
jgi:hypothetical protein